MRYLLLIFVALQLVNCDPRMVKPTAFVTLKANISPNANLRLGDTLKLSVILGDSLEYFDTAGKSSKIYVNSLQEASYGFACDRFDTIRGGIYSSSSSPIFVKVVPKVGRLRAGVGGYPAGDGYLSNLQKPHTSELHFVPKEKGIYYVELRYQPVNIKVNDGFEAQLGLVFDERINRNAEMYCRYGLINRTGAYTIESCVNDPERQRFYTFRVE